MCEIHEQGLTTMISNTVHTSHQTQSANRQRCLFTAGNGMHAVTSNYPSAYANAYNNATAVLIYRKNGMYETN